jgi:hypothetical protein
MTSSIVHLLANLLYHPRIQPRGQTLNEKLFADLFNYFLPLIGSGGWCPAKKLKIYVGCPQEHWDVGIAIVCDLHKHTTYFRLCLLIYTLLKEGRRSTYDLLDGKPQDQKICLKKAVSRVPKRFCCFSRKLRWKEYQGEKRERKQDASVQSEKFA